MQNNVRVVVTHLSNTTTKLFDYLTSTTVSSVLVTPLVVACACVALCLQLHDAQQRTDRLDEPHECIVIVTVTIMHFTACACHYTCRLVSVARLPLLNSQLFDINLYDIHTLGAGLLAAATAGSSCLSTAAAALVVVAVSLLLLVGAAASGLAVTAAAAAVALAVVMLAVLVSAALSSATCRQKNTRHGMYEKKERNVLHEVIVTVAMVHIL
jgi:hypothetical protein